MNDSPNRPGTLEKALKLNLDRGIYGTFAEIGAGQETANWFFRAGGASGTVAKTMSAYDMTFSDEIYGKSARYVSRQRMAAMLDHEFQIVQQRLHAKRGADAAFFALANTVRARGWRDTNEECHGWLGLRFQTEPGGPPNDIQLHVRLLDDTNHRQSEVMGILGVNLLYAAHHYRDELTVFLKSLLDDLRRKRLEIDMVDFIGPAFAKPGFEDRIVALELVRSDLADAALFGASGEILQASDVLYNKPVVLNRGSFDPITRVNLDMIERGAAAFDQDFGEKALGHVEILEITMHNLLCMDDCAVEYGNFLARADILQALGKNVLVSKYAEFHRLSGYLARHTREPIGIILGLPLFEELFNERWYADLEGGLMEAFGRLFRNQVRLYVYPAGDPLTGKIRTASQARVTRGQDHLLRYLLDTGAVHEIREGLEECLFQTSSNVRQMILGGDRRWRDFVPPIVLERGPWAALAG
ncbi:MAG TPA: nicotinate-nucleotide adenylyltransferase [Verrucomicrobiales bacterium]|nr:nicotinate-nucleotide adenylyltransferase [Verrucomicrobiales bacterium]HRJ08597.1 TonB-dependent receptor [Prosthecobacter sp.]HRK16159.1 TonB-dependent receptor [Prosthecobacter sp.]